LTETFLTEIIEAKFIIKFTIEKFFDHFSIIE